MAWWKHTSYHTELNSSVGFTKAEETRAKVVHAARAYPSFCAGMKRLRPTPHGWDARPLQVTLLLPSILAGFLLSDNSPVLINFILLGGEALWKQTAWRSNYYRATQEPSARSSLNNLTSGLKIIFRQL